MLTKSRILKAAAMRFWPLVVAGLSAGCSEAATQTDVPVWTVEPLLRIGAGDEPNYTLNQVSGVAADARGHIYAADAGDHEIKVFDDAGAYVRSLGRQGSGPAEFGRLSTIGAVADTLYVVDEGQQRITYFSVDGAFLRSTPTRELINAPVSVHRAFANGRYLVSPRVRNPSESVPRLLVSNGQVQDTLGFFSGGGVLSFSVGTGRLHVPDPFAAPRFLAVGPDAAWWLTVVQHPEGGLHPGEFTVAAVRVGGEPLWLKRFVRTPIQHSTAEVDSTIDRLATPGGRPPLDRGVVRAALRVPEYKYPLTGLVVASNGDTWMRVTQPDGSSLWIVLDSTGAEIGSVRLPNESAPSVIIGRERVILVERDQLGVQTIVIHALSMRPGI